VTLPQPGHFAWADQTASQGVGREKLREAPGEGEPIPENRLGLCGRFQPVISTCCQHRSSGPTSSLVGQDDNPPVRLLTVGLASHAIDGGDGIVYYLALERVHGCQPDGFT
jgi:hypothetical protein